MYWIGRFLSKVVCVVLGRYRAYGTENVPKDGGVILAPNHISYLDPPAVGVGIRRQVHFMAKLELFQIPVLGFLIKSVGAFPVKRGTADRAALKRAIELLQQGKVVCLFPEGKRSETGEPLDAELGVGMIVLKAKVPVVPVAVIGTTSVLPFDSPLPRFGKIRMYYGKPISFEHLYDKSSDRAAIEEVGATVMESIRKLRSEHL